MIGGVFVFIPESVNVQRYVPSSPAGVAAVVASGSSNFDRMNQDLTAALLARFHAGDDLNKAVSVVNKDLKKRYPSITWDYVRSNAHKSGVWKAAVITSKDEGVI